MRIEFSPCRMDATLVASVSGDVLTLNGEDFDFTPLPAGTVLPRTAIASPWFAGDVTRDDDGQLTLRLITPVPAGATEAERFPAPIEIDGTTPREIVLKETDDAED